MIELTNVEVLLDLTTVKYEDSFCDLHNDYECVEIKYELINKAIGFLFKPRRSGAQDLHLVFEEATVVNFIIQLKRAEESCTLDLFYRGRYEADGNLFEISPNEESVFYIDFLEGDSFVIFSKKVTLERVD